MEDDEQANSISMLETVRLVSRVLPLPAPAGTRLVNLRVCYSSRAGNHSSS